MSNTQNTSNVPHSAEVESELSTIVKHEIEHIWVEPVCDFFKISYQNATRTIKKDHLLQSEWTKKSSELMFLDKRSRFLLTKVGFVRWIQIINPNIIAPELREKFTKFQVAIFSIVYGAVEKRTEHAALYKEYIALKQQAAATSSRLRAVKKELDAVVEQQMLGTEVIDRQHSLPL